MVAPLLCGLFFGWLLCASWRDMKEQQRRKRIIARVQKALDGLGTKSLHYPMTDCPMEVRFSTPCSDDACECNACEAELPEFITGKTDACRCRGG